MHDAPPFSSGSIGICSADLSGFFSKLLFEAAQEKNSSVSPLALSYTSQVLADFSQSQKFFAEVKTRLPVLADMLSEAVEADFYKRVSVLRRLGDTSLMISGYFPEALERRSVDRSYYSQMGENAYSQLSTLTEQSNIFDELAVEFVCLAELVNYMAGKLKHRGLSLEEMLNRYELSKHEELLHLLQERGVFPFGKTQKD